MCGFACLWQIDDEPLAQRMIARIGHRGPDATRVHRAPGVPATMAHCRLSIIGPDDGSQPIHADDHVLVANGEIYNHADLRAILGEHVFETLSDSEAILHLFRSEQARWVDRLDGMFSFVLATPDRIIAARDPMGIKPLYMADVDGGLAFASELKAFDGMNLGPEAIRSIAPGTLYDSQTGERRWHRIASGASEPEPGMDVDAVTDELRLVLEDAVRKWMVADVEVGSFLSGGLDSSIIAAIAARASRQQGRRLKTFAVGLDGSPDLEAAARVAAHIGSDHRELTFTASDMAEALPDVIYHLESADVDLVRSAVPTHFATTLAGRHVKAVLTGEGADELFAGYAYHHDYADDPRGLADELTRSLTTMHNINLQRVDRITMAQGLEARTPFLDRDLIGFAQSIPASLKLHRDDDGATIEKWVLRRACEDLLPPDLVWRKKAQFDEGSGTIDALDESLRIARGRHATEQDGTIDRAAEGELYESILRDRFDDPEMVLANAGTWASDDRVAIRT